MSDPTKSAAVATASYMSAGGALLFGLTANELAAIVGAFCAIATFMVNWWFKYRQLKIIESRVGVSFPNIAEVEQ